MIRVLICDDQVVVCEGLRAILSTSSDLEVVGIASNGVEALELIGRLKPDVALMDLKMPIMNGIQVTRAVHTQFPSTRILVLTTYDFDEWVLEAVRSGAAGYLLKDTPRNQLVEAIKGTAAGKNYIDPNVAGKLFSQVGKTVQTQELNLLKALSDREVDVLKWIARGLNNSDIAARLYLSEGTIRNYVSSILTKLNVTDRTQAAILALKAGLADMNDQV